MGNKEEGQKEVGVTLKETSVMNEIKGFSKINGEVVQLYGESFRIEYSVPYGMWGSVIWFTPLRKESSSNYIRCGINWDKEYIDIDMVIRGGRPPKGWKTIQLPLIGVHLHSKEEFRQSIERVLLNVSEIEKYITTKEI